MRQEHSVGYALRGCYEARRSGLNV